MSDERFHEEATERIIAAYTAMNRWWAQDYKRRTPSGLTSTQFTILTLIDRGEASTVSQLAECLELAVPTVVRAVDALERKGLIARHRSPADQRAVLVEITPAGKERRAAFQQARRNRFMHLLAAMSDDEVNGLVAGYEGLVRATQINDQGELEAV